MFDPPKKILIIYTSSGAGHKKASEAIRDVFIKSHKDIELGFIDSIEFTNPLFKSIYPNGYEFIVNNIPLVWGFFYYLLDMKCLFWAVSKLRRIINYLNCRNVENYIIKNNPDVIITTHFLPVEVISSLKRKRRFKGKLITVVTDFGLHSFWVSKEVDRYVVATELTKRDLLERGISENRIDVLGIPIRSVFVTKKDKRELLSKLGAKEGVFTILIAGGGFGAGPVGILFKNLAGLKYDKQLFVVCGTNTRLQGALETAAKDFPNICKIFGFVENMDELMRVSDILIGKSGGLTCSEALALGTPMIIVSPIPGQEARNTKILVKCGAAIELKNLSDINELVERIILNKEILKNLSENSKSLARPEAARDIANLTLSL